MTVEVQAFAEPGRFINPNGPPRLEAVNERGRAISPQPGGGGEQPERGGEFLAGPGEDLLAAPARTAGPSRPGRPVAAETPRCPARRHHIAEVRPPGHPAGWRRGQDVPPGSESRPHREDLGPGPEDDGGRPLSERGCDPGGSHAGLDGPRDGLYRRLPAQPDRVRGRRGPPLELGAPLCPFGLDHERRDPGPRRWSRVPLSPPGFASSACSAWRPRSRSNSPRSHPHEDEVPKARI